MLITVAGYFYGGQVENQLFDSLKAYVGADIAMQIQNMLDNASFQDRSGWKFAVGLGTMLVGATSVFAEIQSSLNLIWGIKPKPKKGWLKLIMNRLLSFSLIASVGFLLIVSLAVSSLIDLFMMRLQVNFPDASVWLASGVTLLLNFIITGTLFILLFKILPDAKIKFKDVILGGSVTTVLFMVGKFLISLYLSSSNISTTFGAAGSVVLLLVWVYYSALILYFGAEFTKSWALELGGKIYPSEYAVSTKIVEIEEDKPLEAVNKTEVNNTEASSKDESKVKECIKDMEKVEEKQKNKKSE
jgi:membrane protein